MQCVETGQYFARFTMGDIEIVALSDGHLDGPTTRLRKPGNAVFADDLPPEIPLFDGKLRLSVNAFLVRVGDDFTLIDTGASNAWLPTMGRLFDALDEAGIARGSITTVALTHTHEDHVFGLVAPDGNDGFPNLKRLLVPAKEIDLFRQFPSLKRFHDRCTPLEDGFRLSDCIVAVATPGGHEVGHTAFEVKDAGSTLLIWGDIVHVPSVQFAKPHLTWEFDADQDVARATRIDMLRRVSKPKTYIAGSHLDFPGVGSVISSGETYHFVPIDLGSE
ncbi:MAG: MBL fold metallo-hydrolase [Pseudomonadota bacterium]